jgi:hypothetical protein
LIPAASSRLAWVWRRSCSRIRALGGIDGPPERQRDGGRVPPRPLRVGEDEAVGVPRRPGLGLSLLLGRAVGVQHRPGAAVEVDGAPGGEAFLLVLDAVAIGAGDGRVAHRHGPAR